MERRAKKHAPQHLGAMKGGIKNVLLSRWSIYTFNVRGKRAKRVNANDDGAAGEIFDFGFTQRDEGKPFGPDERKKQNAALRDRNFSDYQNKSGNNRSPPSREPCIAFFHYVTGAPVI
jgi:hypothetical protein